MREEISAAVIFLARLLEKGENFNPRQLEEFKARLSELLIERFENHWFPDLPQKGQGYRCIRVNEHSRHDVSLEKAARACGIKYEDMKLPVELTIWVDPNEVCCRFGENKGSYCTLASFNDKENLIEVSEEIKELLDGDIKDIVTPSEKPESPVPTEPKVEDKEEKKTVETVTAETPVKDTKPQTTPLATNNSRQSQQHHQHHHNNNRKWVQTSPKQKSGVRRGGYPPHPHHAPWYNIISPHWMSPSPPPYHPMLRRQGAPLPPHPRYHWPNKSMLKV
ncbi:maternal B9.15 protein-like [Macrosteles quadrilineatus]|uniref:maternal B9.15 protein-like n=1 Tax=Macrosteles quadrilineatus TaxID=74068 RepID=UPI0023E24A7D|nr:maternal B9.15 protein-like [Macrosteles quadrilineatus]XP_054282234.1 maternal B9.15 protein-like [Macrosteles quadrilineatus]